MSPGETGAWWMDGVVYQIYPRSFNDSNGDGIGDIPGITEKLDYLAGLGVDIIWLSPVYESPNFDNGYDISDYRNIMADFGTIADWEIMLREIHARGMRLIMDLVVNHTSSLHPWFIESRRGKSGPYRDYYIWEPWKNGGPPCNWESYFEGPVWQYDEAAGEYYLHLFAPEQPDLNWDNPEVRREVHDIMRFWLDKGIDGFRMDVINLISKDRRFPSVPPSPGSGPDGLGSGEPYFVNGPRVHDYLREMNRQVLAGRDVVTVGETPRVTTDEALLYCGTDRNELDMVFHFEHVDIDQGCEGYWSRKDLHLPDFKTVIEKWQTALYQKGWNSNYLNNHDQPRSVSRFGNDGKYLRESAKLLGVFNFTLSGTPYIYQGEELGMTNVRFDSIHQYRDIAALRYYEKAKRYGKAEPEIMKTIHYRCRDNARTPMQWSAEANAGFSSGEPWIGINPNYTEINAAAELQDPDSVLSFYKKLVRFRREHPALIYGSFELIEPEHPRLFAYVKERLLVLMNFSSEELELPAGITGLFGGAVRRGSAGPEQSRPLLSNYPATPANGAPDRLRPWEAGVWELG